MPTAPSLPSIEELERAVRLLAVRTRREVSTVFAGGYRSAFRGGGIEFEESRPYVPGDDVRTLDWNAMARTGEPYVKRFREERDQTVILAVDVSRSMRFGTAGRAKATVAAHAAALVAAAAGRAGDRVGLVCFDSEVRAEIRPGRGEAHLWRVLRCLVGAAGAPDGGTSLAGALARIRSLSRRHAVVMLLSDFRDDALFDPQVQSGGRNAGGRPSGASDPSARTGGVELFALAKHHDVVAAVLHDLREEELPAVGTLRIADPEKPGRSLVLRSGSARARALYRSACAVRRRALEQRLRADGVDVLWLPAHRDPLLGLARFFRRHHGAAGGSAA